MTYPYGLEETFEERRLRYLRDRKCNNKFERPQYRTFVGLTDCGSQPLNRAGKAQIKVSNKFRGFRAYDDKCALHNLNMGKRFAREWFICSSKKTRCAWTRT